MSNTTLAPLLFSLSNIPIPEAIAYVVPLKCGVGEICHPVLQMEKELLPEVYEMYNECHSSLEIVFIYYNDDDIITYNIIYIYISLELLLISLYFYLCL